MPKSFGLRIKTYSYLIDDSREGKKAKDTKKCFIKRKLKFEIINCLEATEFGNKINHLVKNKINIYNVKEFIKSNKSILKIQQRVKSERDIFTEEINKITLSSNHDKRMKSIDSIETCAYGISKDLVSDKEVIKCNSTIK